MNRLTSERNGLKGLRKADIGMPITEQDLDDMLTKGEAAKYIGVSMATIDRMIANRELDIVRVGSGMGRVRITRRALLDHLNRKEQRADRPRKSAS